MRKFVVLFLTVGMLCMLSGAAWAIEYHDTNWARTAPTIDGVINDQEWWGASRVFSDGGDTDFYAYWYSDDEYLYVAWDIITDVTNDVDDEVGIYFDNDNSGTWPASCADEGSYFIYTDHADFRCMYGSGSVGFSIPTTTITYATSMAAGNRQFEAQIDLDGGEMYGTPGETIGFYTFVIDDTFGTIQRWPETGIVWTDPSTYADLTYAEAPEEFNPTWANLPPQIDGVMDDGEWDDAAELYVNDGTYEYYAYYYYDGTFLWGAVDALSDTGWSPTDGIGLYFDNDFNGVWPDHCGDEGNYFIYHHNTPPDYTYEFRDFKTTSYGTWSICVQAATNSVTGLASLVSKDHIQFEFLVKLDIAEMYSAADESIGFFMFSYDSGLGDVGLWPDGVTWYDPATYGVLTYPAWQVPEFDLDWTDDPPTIDGDINPAEWADATVFVLPDTGVDVDVDTVVYAKADGDFFYAAFDVLDDTALTSGDTARVHFDNDNDNAWPATCPVSDEGRYLINYDGSVEFEAFAGSGSSCGKVASTAATGAAALSSKGNVQYEIMVDLAGGEMYGAMDETIGIRFFVYDTDMDDNHYWPFDSVYTVPSTYADMTYSACDGCWADGECWPDGTIDPLHDCQWCDVATATVGWSFRPNSVECRTSAGDCDVAEFCTGSAADCPADGFLPDTTECRAAAHDCDEAEFCTGADADCPTDAMADDGTACDDTLFCNGDDTCLSGACDDHAGDPCPAGTTCDEDLDECLAADDDIVDDDIVDDDVADDDVADDDVADDDVADDDVVDDDVADDDVADDDVADDDAADDDAADDDDDDDSSCCGC